MRPLLLALLLGVAALLLAGVAAAQDRPAPRYPHLTPEGRDFLQRTPLGRSILGQPPRAVIDARPQFTMVIVPKDPADYPIVVTRGKDADYPIRIIRPGGPAPEAPGDGSKPLLIVPLPNPDQPGRMPSVYTAPRGK